MKTIQVGYQYILPRVVSRWHLVKSHYYKSDAITFGELVVFHFQLASNNFSFFCINAKNVCKLKYSPKYTSDFRKLM